jgi:hypothetical protein
VQNVSNTNDPLKARVQSVLGQFEIVQPLLNVASIGVPLAPMTPVGAQHAMPLLKFPDGRTAAGSADILHSGMQPPHGVVAKAGDRNAQMQGK